MKKILCILIVLGIFFIGCKKHNSPSSDNAWVNGIAPSSTDITQWLLSKSPSVKNFTILSVSGGTITNDSISVFIPSDAFAKNDGTAYNGTVTIKMQTIRSTANMMFSGITTIAGPKLLASGGMFKIEAYDNSNNALKLKTSSSLTAIFSAATYDTAYKIFRGTTITNSNNQIDWILNNNASAFSGGQIGGGTGGFGMDLFTWTNLDQYMDGTPLTDLSISVPAGFGNNNCTCAFRYSNVNTIAYIPANVDLKSFSTQGLYYKVIGGRAAKIICIAKKDGKFYYQISDISSITTNHSVSIPTMIEVSETNLQNIIGSF